MTRAALCAAVAVLVGGCSSSVGPVVKDVRFAPDGSLVLETCDLTISPGVGSPDLSLEDCKTEKRAPPR